jgi:hypothetical protein
MTFDKWKYLAMKDMAGFVSSYAKPPASLTNESEAPVNKNLVGRRMALVSRWIPKSANFTQL